MRLPGLVSALPSRPFVELAGYSVVLAGLILLHVFRMGWA